MGSDPFRLLRHREFNKALKALTKSVVGLHKRGNAYENLRTKGDRLLRMMAEAAAEFGGTNDD